MEQGGLVGTGLPQKLGDQLASGIMITNLLNSAFLKMNTYILKTVHNK